MRQVSYDAEGSKAAGGTAGLKSLQIRRESSYGIDIPYLTPGTDSPFFEESTSIAHQIVLVRRNNRSL